MTNFLSRFPIKVGIALALISALSPAQWNPPTGQWSKTNANDIRVMTWNVRDTLCSTNAKISGQNNWTATARIVAAMKPDVLILQECADNNGNGTGSNVDSVANLTTTLNLWLHGGLDTFHAGSPPVTAYVQLYAPGYDLPNIFVSSVSDGFNRNVIMSRWPFADLNGDTKSTMVDIPTISADLYAPGGQGGIRGFMTAEVALPNATYAGDLVIGNCHLKAGGTASDHTARVAAAQDIAYFIDYFWNGAGGSTPDPHAKIADSPAASAILGANTPLICGGDWNEDELTNSTPGPAAWITRAQNTDAVNGTDGTDRNRTDMTFEVSVDQFTNSHITEGGSKYDYVAWQDSIVTPRRSFVFNTNTLPTAAIPTEVLGWSSPPINATTVASDHRPVICDFIFAAPLGCNSAGTDLGFAKLGGNATYPRFAACGGLATGQTATLALTSAAPNATAYLGYSLTQSYSLLFGGTVIPNPTSLFGPVTTNAAGAISLPVGGGGGPFTIYGQWAILDAGATSGVAFSNAERLNWLP